MKFFIVLIGLVQLLNWATAQKAFPVRDLDCDDPEAEQAAAEAVRYINTHRQHGYKYALNQIEKVKTWQRRPFGEVFDMELDLLETNCHVLDPTPLENCTVRSLVDHAVEGDCDVKLLKLEGKFTVLFAKCDSSPDSAEDVLKVCPDCSLLALLNDSAVTHAVEAALAKFNSENNGSYFLLLEISRAKKVNLPPSTVVEFVVGATDCAAKEVSDPAKCNVVVGPKQTGFCKASLFYQAGGGEEVQVNCVIFDPQPAVPQRQPDGADVAGATARPVEVATPGGAGPGAAVPRGPLVPRFQHHDLRHSFRGPHHPHLASSPESASGEQRQPLLAVLPQPGPQGPVPQLPVCPGRLRHFKV
ncbi:alpha-2-HS-glycoprotein [Tachyglossus aculeatus]|uniref:alpha-2-HS-glycoprotein n=1 Tax=Tachyglossus aculeatus TaxID=9261 RepID=UPI0018F4DFC6|nr:alpha-2-HS-glycoprotein [Tachyglossus aculeatus]